MGIISSFYEFGVVQRRSKPAEEGRPPAPGGAASTQFVFITPETLTFPGVAVASGIVASLVQALLDVEQQPDLRISSAVGVVVGALLTWLSIAKLSTTQRNVKGFVPQALLVALFNTALLIASIHGIAELAPSDDGGTTPTPGTTTEPVTTTTTG